MEKRKQLPELPTYAKNEQGEEIVFPIRRGKHKKAKKPATNFDFSPLLSQREKETVAKMSQHDRVAFMRALRAKKD